MAEIKVTSQELKNKAAALRQLNKTFKNKVAEMTQNEQRLMTMWDGEAKDAFHKAYISDKGQMDAFYQVIEQYCVALEKNATKYEQIEKKNLSTAATRTYK